MAHQHTLPSMTPRPGHASPTATRRSATRDATTARPAVAIRQYGRGEILAVWSAAALPMGLLAWLVAPALAGRSTGVGDVPMFEALIASLTGGLVWQFLLVMGLVAREQRTVRLSTLREALWLRAPVSPRTGRAGGKVWLVLIPLVVAFAAAGLIPSLPMPANRDLTAFLGSDAGQGFLSGNRGWFALMVVLWIFNTVLGEELLSAVSFSPG